VRLGKKEDLPIIPNRIYNMSLDLIKLKYLDWNGPYESDTDICYCSTIPGIGKIVIHDPIYGKSRWISVCGIHIDEITDDDIGEIILHKKTMMKNAVVKKFKKWLYET
jgi:hypothetical protein